MVKRALCATPSVIGAIVLLGALAACGGSSGDVVRKPTSTPSAPSSTSALPSTPAPVTSSSSGPRRPPVLQVVPHAKLHDGQTVQVRATGFTAGQAYTVIQCAQKGTATGPGDCNLTGMQTVTGAADGSVRTQLRVVKGPFGANQIVCSAKQACLISVTQASLSPTEEADQAITFAP